MTFDQPLFVKACDIFAVLLSGLHLLLSFLGCIGHLIAGSGLKEALSLISAPNTVRKAFLGHAYARTVIQQMLRHEALTHIFLSRTTDLKGEEQKLMLISEGQTIRIISEKLQIIMAHLVNEGSTA